MKILFVNEPGQSTDEIVRELTQCGHSVATAPDGAAGLEMVQIMWPSQFDAVVAALDTDRSWDLLENTILHSLAPFCVATTESRDDLDRTQLDYLRIPCIEKPLTAEKIFEALEARDRTTRSRPASMSA